MLGLKHNVNRLVDYDPEWPKEFSRERDRIITALGDQVKAVEHYGSTAVPGMRAKPIIDIQVGIDLAAWEACKAPLEALGYDYWPDAGVPDHYIFGRGRDTTERTHHLHLVQYEGSEWVSNLRFRNALRRDGDLRAAYTAVKECAAMKAPVGRPDYNKIKGPFIEAVKARLATEQPQARSSNASGETHMTDKPKSSDELIPQADQQASAETAQHAGEEGEQAKVLQQQAKQGDQSKVIEQAKENKDQ